MLRGKSLWQFYSRKHGDSANWMLLRGRNCYGKTDTFGFVDNLPEKPDKLPRLIKRQAGESKKMSDCRELVALYKELDLHKVELPQFVADNLSRVPMVKPGEGDIYYMAVNKANLTLQLEKMSVRLAVLESAKSSSLPTSTSLDSSVVPPTPNLPVHIQPNGPTLNLDGWFGVAGNNLEEWKKIETKKSSRTSVPIRVKGSRRAADVGDKLKAVPRRAILAAYVGRLQPDTTPEILSQYLKEAGMKGVVCKKLKVKPGTNIKTAAFYVTCSTDSAELFYDHNC